MTGSQHYEAAGELLTAIPQCRNEDPACPFCTRDLMKAQVHATLALAAATADPFDRQREWSEVTR